MSNQLRDCPNRRPLQVWLVSEGNAGHTSQSRGLAEALARHCPMELQVVEAPMTLRGGLRPLLRWYLRLIGPIPENVLGRCYKFPGLPTNYPDMIISSGGKSVPLAVSLARKFRAKFVYCGPPAPYPLGWFDIVLSPAPVPGHSRAILTEMLLTQVTPQIVKQAGMALRERLAAAGAGKVGAVLIGGRSRSNRFEAEDWRSLARGMNELSVRFGWKWLITTSRRTGVEAEAVLRGTLLAQTLADSAWWHDEPKKVVRAYLGACDAVFVTQDSLTMISEAVSSGKPTIAIRPRQVRESAYLAGVISRQVGKHRLASLQCDQLLLADDALSSIRPVTESVADHYALEVLKMLGLNDRPSV